MGNVLTALWGALHQVCDVTCFCCRMLVVVSIVVRVRVKGRVRVGHLGQFAHGRCTRFAMWYVSTPTCTCMPQPER